MIALNSSVVSPAAPGWSVLAAIDTSPIGLVGLSDTLRSDATHR